MMSLHDVFLIGFFSAFLGVYAVCCATFFVVSKNLRVKEFKSFFYLTFFLSLYLIGCLVFVSNESERFNANFIFLFQLLTGAGCFYFYLKSITERFYIRSKTLSLVKGSMILFMSLSALFGFLYIAADVTLFKAVEGLATKNIFINEHMRPYAPKTGVDFALGLPAFFSVLGNLYLFIRLKKEKLVGIEKLVLAGIILSFFANLNDNLIGADILVWSFPMLPIAYILETVYFLFLSLVTYPKAHRTWSRYELLKKEDVAKNKRPDFRPVAEVFNFAACRAAEKFPEIDVSIENAFSESLMTNRQDDGLLVFFYFLVEECLISSGRAKMKTCEMKLENAPEPGLLVIVDKNPNNSYDMRKVMKVSEIYRLGLEFRTGRQENKFFLRF